MIQPASYEYAIAATQPARTEQADSTTRPATRKQTVDTVSISAEAQTLHKQDRSGEADEKINPWTKHFGIEEGESILPDGRKRVVTFEDSKMTLLEYEGDRLVKKEVGEFSGNSAVVDIEQYNRSGEITQTNHSELYGIGSTDKSEAVLHRDVQWFERGELKKELHDSMLVNARYTLNTKALAAVEAGNDFMKNVAYLTSEAIGSQYSGSLSEYKNGNLIEHAIIEQNVASKTATNRDPDRVDDGTSPVKVIEQSNSLFVNLTSFDDDGNKLREVSLSDSVTRGKAKQTTDTAWYAEGELVKKTSGSVTIEPEKGKAFPARPNILETLQLDEEQFAAWPPPTAKDMLSMGFDSATHKPGHQLDTLQKDLKAGEYDAMSKAAQNGLSYDAQWSEELYRDGEIIARQEDTKSARVSLDLRGMAFRTGGALSEDFERPSILHESSHSTTAFKDGNEVSSASTEFRESVEINEDGPDKLQTHFETEQRGGAGTKGTSGMVDGSLASVDEDSASVLQSFNREIELTLMDSMRLFDTLSEEEKERQEKTGIAPAGWNWS